MKINKRQERRDRAQARLDNPSKPGPKGLRRLVKDGELSSKEAIKTVLKGSELQSQAFIDWARRRK